MRPNHFQSGTRIEKARIEKVRVLVSSRGWQPTSRMLGCNIATLDRILGPGTLKRDTAERLSAAIDAVKADGTTSVG